MAVNIVKPDLGSGGGNTTKPIRDITKIVYNDKNINQLNFRYKDGTIKTVWAKPYTFKWDVVSSYAEAKVSNSLYKNTIGNTLKDNDTIFHGDTLDINVMDYFTYPIQIYNGYSIPTEKNKIIYKIQISDKFSQIQPYITKTNIVGDIDVDWGDGTSSTFSSSDTSEVIVKPQPYSNSCEYVSIIINLQHAYRYGYNSSITLDLADSGATIVGICYGTSIYEGLSDMQLTLTPDIEDLIILPSAFYTGLNKEGLLKDYKNLKKLTIPFVGEYQDGEGSTYFSYIFGGTSWSENYTKVPSSLREVNVVGGKTIGYAAFNACTNLTKITLPDTLETIKGYAFNSCHNITEITIPSSVTTLEKNIFNDCNKLIKITIPFINTDTNCIGGFFGATSFETNKEFIPETLREVVLTNCTRIPNRTFWAFHNLTNITLPNTLTTIGEWAFAGCRSLENIIIPDSVTTIGTQAFENCTGLTEIIIPKSVTTIGSRVFNECSNLTVYCEAGSKPDGWNSLWAEDVKEVRWGYKK